MRTAIPLLALALAGCTRERSAPPDATIRTGDRPNVVVVVVDDWRWDEFGAAGHPYVETPNLDRLAAEGALFVNAFHAVPLCSPNRATLLTGQFPSAHGIIDNVSRSLASHRLHTFPATLQGQGYRTAFLGKWHMGNDPTPRPGFDYWVGLPGQGRSVDPEFFEDGRLQAVPGYATDLLTDRAIGFMQENRGRPYLVYLAHKAIHPDVVQRDDGSVDPESEQGYIPAPRHRGRYDGKAWTPRGNRIDSLGDLAGKPVVRQALARLPDSARRVDETAIRRRAEMLLAVDESLGRILAELSAQGVLDRTAVIVTSDNGFFYGEHGLTSERRLPYEESIRNPLLLRYPPRVPAGARPDGLALTVDLAPTVLDLAGAGSDPAIQGRSLMPLLERPGFGGWRDALLVEFYTYENPFPHLLDVDYRAIRTPRYKYIHWIKYPDRDELYDLEADPLERQNLAAEPRMAATRNDLRDRLGRLVLESLWLGGRR